MRRTLCCLLTLGALAFAARAQAQEPIDAELDFVRKLRARGSVDLAKSYLEMMQKRGDPALAGILPLEQARTVLAAARAKEPDQRFGFFTQARDLLTDYTKQNAGKPEEAQGKLELARLSTYEGQALLSKALRELDTAAQQDLAKPAEKKFVAASGELDAAIKLLEKLVEDANLSETAKKPLRQDLTQARFDKGANFINQARTYVNTSKEDLNLKRAQIVQEAKKVFDTLREEEALGIRSQANAWLMKIAMESQDPGEIQKFYNRVMSYKSADARAGQRLARYFDMQDALTNQKNPRAHPPKVKQGKYDTIHHVQKLGLLWLKDYPTYTKTPEGEGVLWELGNAYYVEAKEAEAEKKVKHKPPPETLYQLAQKYYGRLAQGEGDYSEKANQMSLSISYQLMGKRKDFRTFEEFFLKGQFEMMELQKLGGKRADALAKGDGKDAESLDKQWKDKLAEVRRTFGKALAAATERTPIQKLDEARFILTFAFLASGDLYRAAVAGEALGRTRPPTRRAPSGAGYAMEAYASLLQKQYTDDTKERLRELIEYVLSKDSQKFWATDPVSSVAHYQAGLMADKDGDFRRAIKELESLPREYPAYTYAQGQLVFIALRVKRENTNLTKKEKDDLVEKVRGAAKRMPLLASDTDSTTAFMYYLAQLELSKIQYADAYTLLREHPLKAKQSFIAMRDFLKGLGERFEKSPIKMTPKSRNSIIFELAVMQKYANLGLAESDYRDEKFDEVLKVTQPMVDAVKKADTGKGAIKMRDYEVTGDILGLALRAQVRKGNIPVAKNMLDTIKRLGGEDATEGASDVGDRVTRNLIAEIRLQVKELENKPAELKKVIGSFRTFLDEMMKGRDLHKLPLDERLTLAQAFSGLGVYDKAAELYAHVPAPKALSSKLPYEKQPEADQKALQEYWSFKWEHVKSLRAAKDYAGAFKLLDGVKGEPGWLNHPQALFAMPYGHMEKNFIMEDDKKYGAAFQAWTKFMKVVQNKVGTDNKMKKLYFDAYFYRIRCLNLYGMHDPGVKNRQNVTDLAAKQILGLEFANSKDGWDLEGERFEQLLKEQPRLKEAYDRLKKARIEAAK